MPKGNETTNTQEFYLDADNRLRSRYLGLRPTRKLTPADKALEAIMRGDHVFVRATDAAVVHAMWRNRHAEDAIE